MEIRLLRYFLAVAKEENITRAAKSLHISQPSLSKQLMELEQEIGKQLLIREKRKITPTEEGILLRKRADEIITLLEKTKRELNADAIDVLERMEHSSLDFSVFLEPIGAMQYEYISLQDSSRWGLLVPSDHALAKKGFRRRICLRPRWCFTAEPVCKESSLTGLKQGLRI